MLFFCAAYPMFVVALWIGALNQSWTVAATLVSLGVLMSFTGWALLCPFEGAHDAATMRDCEDRDAAVTVFLALYNRTGAAVVLLASYAVAARTQGWPAPETFIGWFLLAWIPLFALFALPIESASTSPEPNP